ncbi:hypothetical protein [Cupriavidus alkaliphilus]|uniref:hypothetical protein n=1 Tax=Cupriavidus alkaliphilus TaxID=942866 RepID=UPI00114D2354|nr:hypothetical protein [Cupriavidus alkaliphilus]
MTKLARRAFLTLWSYPNVYTDEGRGGGTGDGKELCDLLVVFGDHILLFSDKECEFSEHADPKVAWYRWYRRAIEKSAKQLAGAEAWVRRYPGRIFVDRQCRQQLPLDLVRHEHLKIHLIAVAKGSAKHAKAHWDASGKGSSGSLILNTEIRGSEHLAHPFNVGWPLSCRKMVHVFDDETLDIVLQELDTIADFVAYLDEKERHLTCGHAEFLVLGEEELLAFYLKQARRLPEVPEGALAVIGEGEWKKFKSSRPYRKQLKARKISYLWDDIIEYQISHILAGSAYSIDESQSITDMETVLRAMAEEPRHMRTHLGAVLHRARKIGRSGKRYATAVKASGSQDRAYVVISLPKPSKVNYDEYREARQYQLVTYAEGCKLRLPQIREVIGIAFEPYSTKTISVDFMLMRFHDDVLDASWRIDIERRLQQEDMWRRGIA